MNALAELAIAACLATGPHPSAWEADITGYGFFVPDQPSFAMAVATGDHGAFHLEGRYNYEDRQTGSLFVGWNGHAGDKLELDATLMTGGVFGRSNGVAPGYRLVLSYGSFELFTEGEYLVDLEDVASSFFYSWSEVDYAVFEWARIGLVAQRTRVYHTALDIQRGVFARFSYRDVSLTLYELNALWESPTIVCSLGARF